MNKNEVMDEADMIVSDIAYIKQDEKVYVYDLNNMKNKAILGYNGSRFYILESTFSDSGSRKYEMLYIIQREKERIVT